MEPAYLKFITVCRQNRLQLDNDAQSKLQHFQSLLVDWNSKVNLVSRADVENIWFSHILHSLSILLFCKVQDGTRILDLGTGGGFPGIPLSIALPSCRFVLLDSIRKKTNAVLDMVTRLGLSNVEVHTGRAEEIAKTHGSSFDVVVSRAVAPLVDLVKWSKPLARKSTQSLILRNGEFVQTPALVALKGGDLADEIETAKHKTQIVDPTIINLVFNGSEEFSLIDKKLLIVQL